MSSWIVFIHKEWSIGIKFVSMAEYCLKASGTFCQMRKWGNLEYVRTYKVGFWELKCDNIKYFMTNETDFWI